MDEVGAHAGRQTPTRLPRWLCPLIGAGSAVFGLLPWLVTGLRLPLQNLWATETASDQMPLVLLPFSQYLITLIIVVLVLGAAVAGICARVLRPRLPRWSVPAVAAGVLVVQVVALVQTTSVVGAGLSDRRDSGFYLAALVAVSILSVVVGTLVLGLIAAAPKAAAVIGLSIAALASGPWLESLVAPDFSFVYSPTTLQLLDVVRWAPPVLVGAAIAWSGLPTVGRVAAAGVGLLLLWVVPALTDAIESAAGTRVLARNPTGMARHASEVFNRALTTPELVLRHLLVAVVVAAVGILGHRILGAHLAPHREGGQHR